MGQRHRAGDSRREGGQSKPATARRVLRAEQASAGNSAVAQLASFIAKFDPENQSRIRTVRRALRKRLPAANELVYDNYNFFVIGYAPTERPSDAFLSIAANANGVSLFFLQGARLPDPSRILHGGGTRTRFLRIDTPAVLDRPEVEALIAAAVANAKPMAKNGRGKLIIRSVSAKQRPRRKA